MSTHRVRAACVAALMAALAIVLAACGQAGSGTSSQSVEDSGVNARLSNEELVSKALNNMQALKSYQFDFEGVEPAGAITPDNQMAMTGYELLGKGMRAKLQSTSERTEEEIGASSFLGAFESFFSDPMTGEHWTHDLIVLGQDTYIRTNADNTWRRLSGQDMGLLLRAFLCSWDSTSATAECGAMIKAVKLAEVEPRIELTGGVPTRHLAGDLLAASTDPSITDMPAGTLPLVATRLPETLTLGVWVSTDVMPTVRRMQVNVTIPSMDQLPDMGQSSTSKETYSLTWTWSRFNEDLGDVKPPPTETIQQP